MMPITVIIILSQQEISIIMRIYVLAVLCHVAIVEYPYSENSHK